MEVFNIKSVSTIAIFLLDDRLFPLKGFVNVALSCKVFMPLGRLCYSAYLINLTLTKVFLSSQRNQSYMTESTVILNFLGFLVATFSISFVISLFVEMPFLNLDKLIWKAKVATAISKVNYDS